MDDSKHMVFDEIKDKVMRVLELCLKNDENKIFEEEWSSLESCDSSERSPVVDFCFRELLRKFKNQNSGDGVIEKILDLSIDFARKDLCLSSVPVLLLSDIFDTSSIHVCENLFTLVEKRVDAWKQESFFSGCKNHLLRCCNDLLRRLSRSQNTVFCGRILMFLATLFPLSERSGLNIASEFNIDNKTQFSSVDTDDMSNEADVESEGVQSNGPKNPIIVDYNLYRKFWELQEYFREPNQLYGKIPWKKFISYSNDVMSAFEGFKLDHVKNSSWRTEDLDSNADKSVYFAKYLTSPKLLDLEMSDTNFRRYVLLQFLILFQYLTSSVKFKTEKKLSLSDDQNLWITNAESKVYKLLGETPPDGAHFAKCTRHILEREEHWNNWKNEGCPKFDHPVDKKADSEVKKPTRKRRPPIGNVVREAALKKKILMGNAELTRLWNLCPNNMEACRSSKRNFMPSIETYFDEAIEQLKPEHEIEDQYKLIHDANFGWKSLRLLARQSHHFFTHTNQPSKSLPAYLENMMSKIVKELPQHLNAEELSQTKSEPVEMSEKISEMAEHTEDSEDELLKNEDQMKNNSEEDKKSSPVTLEHIPVLAQKLGAEWKNLAPKLGFQEDEVLFIESEHSSSAVEQARKMLILWTENEGEDATVHNFTKALDSLNLSHLAEDVFQAMENGSNDGQLDE